MKKYLYILMSAVLMVFSAGCSKDEASQDDLRDYCYTGIVKSIRPETGSVQVVIMEDPKIVSDRPIRGDEILFTDKDLTDAVFQVDDVIEFKIIEYEMFNRVGGLADSPMYYLCKVKPCK